MRARGPATEDSGARVSFPVCWRGSDVQERSEAAQTFSLFVLFCLFRDLQIPNFNRSLGARRHPPENDPARKLDHSMLIDERAAAREQAEDYGRRAVHDRARNRARRQDSGARSSVFYQQEYGRRTVYIHATRRGAGSAECVRNFVLPSSGSGARRQLPPRARTQQGSHGGRRTKRNVRDRTCERTGRGGSARPVTRLRGPVVLAIFRSDLGALFLGASQLRRTRTFSGV